MATKKKTATKPRTEKSESRRSTAAKPPQKISQSVKETMDKLRESEKKYRTIFELSPGPIATMSPEGYVTDMNDRIYDHLGYRPDEIIGKHFLELPFFTEEGKTKLMENFIRRFQGVEIPPYDIEFISKHGHRRVGNLIASLVRDTNGAIKESILIFSDITHLKETEEKLLALNREIEETNKRLQRAYNWMRERHNELRKQMYEEEVGFLIDREGCITGVTEQALECLGKSWSQLLGVNLAEFLDGEGAKDFQRELKQVWKGIANWITVELLLNRGPRPFDMRMVRLTGEEKRYLFAIFR